MLSKKIVAFDAYGTLCYISSQFHPYRKLLNSYSISPTFLRHELMTKPDSLKEIVREFEIDQDDLAEIENLILQEVKSVTLFPEVMDTLQFLQMKDFRLAIVSNLAQPYSEPLRQYFSKVVNCMIFSFEVGAVKPNPKIFQALCDELRTLPDKVIMVGDSKKSDIQGAQGFGIQAIHLDRTLTPRQAKQRERCIADIGMLLNLIESPSES